MAQLIRLRDNRNGYRLLVDFVRERGRRQPSRNGDTLEVDDMVIELADPTMSIPSGIGRRGYSVGLGLLEGLQLVAGDTYDDLMVQLAPNTAQFREPNGKFHGGYGRRIGWQMGPMVERLQADPDSRQCVVTIWDPQLDADKGKRDYPCTCLFNWRIRDGRLLMATFMRSQDAHWGWPYDAVMFSTLQLALASYLGVEPGSYTHHAASFHIYTRDLEALDALHAYDGTDVRLPAFRAAGATSWRNVQGTADDVLNTLEYGGSNPPTQNEWYYETIKKRLDRAERQE